MGRDARSRLFHVLWKKEENDERTGTTGSLREGRDRDLYE